MDKKFEATPQQTPIDYKKLREEIFKRFSETIEYLAKN